MIPDRINPFIIDEEKMNFDSSKDGTLEEQLAKWQAFKLSDC